MRKFGGPTKNSPGVHMQVTTTRTGDEAVVIIAGDVDSETSPQLEAELTAVLRAGARSMIVDVEAVSFLGSTGLSVLIGAHRAADRFELRRGNRIVDRLIELTGLGRLYGDAEPV